MPVAVTVEAPGMSREAYVALHHETAPKITDGGGYGLLFHSAGIVDGVLVAMDVWESREDFERFEREILRPSIQAAEGSGPPPSVQIVELFNLWAPGADRLGQLGADPSPN